MGGHDTIVLGAFGCGAFANDPVLVAQVMNQVFRQEFVGCFERVVYCHMDGQRAQPQIWNAFSQHFINAGTTGTSTHTPVRARKFCKFGCNHTVRPGTTSKGNPYDTCCRECAKSKGRKHSEV